MLGIINGMHLLQFSKLDANHLPDRVAPKYESVGVIRAVPALVLHEFIVQLSALVHRVAARIIWRFVREGPFLAGEHLPLSNSWQLIFVA